MTPTRLDIQLLRANANLATCDEVPLHAAQTAFARGDFAYFERWVAHESAHGRTPDDGLLADAREFLDMRFGRR